MEVIDLNQEHEDLYCKCLEDWSDEMKDAGDVKKEWLGKKKSQGLRVKFAKEDDKIVGMIQYIPIESAPISGKDLYYIYCIWIHGYKKGVGNYQGKGIGTMLLNAAEEDARKHGSKGMVAWGIILPFFMRSKWFKKHDYRKVDKDGITELVWKPFTDDAIPPKLIKQKKVPTIESNKVTITCIKNGWCPAQNIVAERIKRIALENVNKVNYIEVDSEDRENLETWGLCDAVFIDKKKLEYGPPPSYEKLKMIVSKKLKTISR